MTALDPQDEWADLCEEHRVAQKKESEAISRAFSRGRIASAEAMAEINRAREPVAAVRHRMDAFLKRQKKG